MSTMLRANHGWTVFGLVAAAGLSLTVSGCGQQASDRVPGGGGPLAIDAFKGEPAPALPQPSSPPTSTPAGEPGKPQPAARPVAISEAALTGGVRDVVVLAGDPKDAVVATARPVSQPAFLDGVIGQINGKPVYADRFLGRLDGQLRALVKQTRSNREWLQAAAKLIRELLVSDIRDELLLAEARAALTPEEKAGLVFFLTSIRENLASLAGGSEERAEERVLEAEGKTLTEKAKDERDKALIGRLFSQQIQPRVNVSWRDVRKAYERSYAEFNPPPIAHFRMIWAAPDAPGKPSPKAEITRLLGEGRTFEEVARSEFNAFSRADGGAVPPRPVEGPYREATLFADPTLNARARDLSPGQSVGPFEFQNRSVWILLERLEQKPGRSLADAQIEIARALRARKYNEEIARYFQRILERGSFSDIDAMTERLLVLASERYLTADRAREPAPPTSGAPAGAERSAP